MGLVRRIDSISNKTEDRLNEYRDVFTGLGCISDVTDHIQIDKDHTPVVYPPRRVPVTLRPKVKRELQCMEQLGVIERVHEATEWMNSMVTVTKPNGKLRICIDPQDLRVRVRAEICRNSLCD